jgi:hypothetical protein
LEVEEKIRTVKTLRKGQGKPQGAAPKREFERLGDPAAFCEADCGNQREIPPLRDPTRSEARRKESGRFGRNDGLVG